MTQRTNGHDERIVDARSSAARQRVAIHAAELLDRGELIGLPTETVYGIAASAADAEAVRRLWESRGEGEPGSGSRGVLAWHVASPADLVAAAPLRSPAHRRLVERLAPGPVTFAVELTELEAQNLCERTGAARGVFEDGAQCLFRCPAPELTRLVLARARGPIVMAAVSFRGEPARTAGDALESIDLSARASGEPRSHVRQLLDDGSTAMGRHSTLVRLTRAGGYRVVRKGAVEERYIDKQLDMTIVFVCTGNTCRSPMATAIARHLLAENDVSGIRVTVLSAGVGAGSGSPATSEAVEAVRRMGVTMGAHSSAFLTRELITGADLVLGMTRSHVESARAIDPSASSRIMLLDPDGRDIPDPIGMSQQVYDQTAGAIRVAIERRLAAIQTAPGS